MQPTHLPLNKELIEAVRAESFSRGSRDEPVPQVMCSVSGTQWYALIQHIESSSRDFRDIYNFIQKIIFKLIF